MQLLQKHMCLLLTSRGNPRFPLLVCQGKATGWPFKTDRKAKGQCPRTSSPVFDSGTIRREHCFSLPEFHGLQLLAVLLAELVFSDL